jgi:hypothetical protein
MTAYRPLRIAGATTLEEIKRSLEEWDRNMNAMLNGGLNFGDNFDGDSVSVTTNATPNTEDAVAHGLGRIPSGFEVITKDKAGDIYASGTAWTATSIYIKSTVAAVTATLRVF